MKSGIEKCKLPTLSASHSKARQSTVTLADTTSFSLLSSFQAGPCRSEGRDHRQTLHFFLELLIQSQPSFSLTITVVKSSLSVPSATSANSKKRKNDIESIRVNTPPSKDLPTSWEVLRCSESSWTGEGRINSFVGARDCTVQCSCSSMLAKKREGRERRPEKRGGQDKRKREGGRE